MNKTREHLTCVEDKCLQCSRFFLILPSTPCSSLKASEIICWKCTWSKCFLIRNSVHIPVQLAELCWCNRDQNSRWVVLNTYWQLFWKLQSLVVFLSDWGKQRILRRDIFRFVGGKTGRWGISVSFIQNKQGESSNKWYNSCVALLLYQ